MMKILIAGCGSIGARHLEVLGWRRDVAIAAFDPGSGMRERVGRINPSAAFYDKYEDALRWGPELVIVATPNHLHEAPALAAFANGAHVLCEKPIAHTMAAGERMVAAARAAGRVLAIGYTERFRPAWRRIQQMADAGEFGSLIGGRAMIGTYNTILCSPAAATNPQLGSILVDYSHELDLLGAIFGAARDLVCRASDRGDRAGLEARPHVAVTLIEYHQGALVSIHMDYIQHPQRRLLEIFGDRKSVVYNLQTNTLEIFETEREGCQTIHFPVSRNECFAAEHDDMIHAIREGGSPCVTGEAGLAVLAVAERAIGQIAAAR